MTAEEACDKMKKQTEESNLQGALCVVLVFGSQGSGKESVGPSGTESDAASVSHEGEDPPRTERVSQKLVEGVVVTKVIQVPEDDVFGLSEALEYLTPTAQVYGELYGSHPFLMAHGVASDSEDELAAPKAMRTRSPTVLMDHYEKLRQAVVRTKTESGDDDRMTQSTVVGANQAVRGSNRKAGSTGKDEQSAKKARKGMRTENANRGRKQ